MDVAGLTLNGLPILNGLMTDTYDIFNCGYYDGYNGLSPDPSLAWSDWYWWGFDDGEDDYDEDYGCC